MSRSAWPGRAAQIWCPCRDLDGGAGRGAAASGPRGYVGLSESVHQIAGATTTDGLLGPAAERLAVKVGATLEWTLFDAHGDLCGLLSTAGAVVRAYRYAPYGEVVASYQAGLASPWRYQGALDRNEGASPLYAIGARAYAPSLGAWTSLDTFAGSPVDPASLNRFLYAEANPTSLIDPSGHRAVYEDGDVCPSCDAHGSGQISRPASSVSGVKTVSRWSTVRRVTRTATNVPASETHATPTATRAGVAGVLKTRWDNLAHPHGVTLFGAADAGSRIDETALCVACGGGYGSGWGENPTIHDLLRVAGEGLTIGSLIAAPVQTLALTGVDAVAGPEAAFAAAFISPTAALRGALTRAGEAVRGGRALLDDLARGGAGNARLPQDLAIEGLRPTRPNMGRGLVGPSSAQNAFIQRDVARLMALKAEDIRVNQQQVNAAGVRVGINRPDLQYTLDGVRYYAELDHVLDSTVAHGSRILANDPDGVFDPYLFIR